MGIAVTCVCTIAAYSSTLTVYNYLGTGNPFTYSAIVQGGNCSFIIGSDAAPQQVIDIFNVTGSVPVLEGMHCTLNSSNTCQTNWQVFNDGPFQYVTLDFENLNVSTGVLTDKQNWTYVSLPPVPSQSLALTFDPTNSTANAQVSTYSSEYGSPLTGCVLSASPSGASYTGANLPARLSSDQSSNSLPWTSSAQYGVSQGSVLSFPLSSLNLNASTNYDFVFVCYNGNGPSPAILQINRFTSSSLPTPQPQPPNTPTSGAVVQYPTSYRMGWAAAMAGVFAVMALSM